MPDGVSDICAAAPAVHVTHSTIESGRRIFIPALSLFGFDFSRTRRMRVLDHLLYIFKSLCRAAGICPNEISDQHEIRARPRKFSSLLARGRKPDTGRF